jgi:fructose-bisphosphate aldolase, class I
MSKANPFTAELIETARRIATPGKGILAADESTGTIGQRFSKIEVENNYENRQAYRTLLFTTPGLGQFISGVIEFEETLDNKDPDGTLIQEYLYREGIIPGIKVDKGTVPIPGTDGETATLGLDGLAERCKGYYEKGCRFAKWRAVLKIGPGLPSERAILENAHGLARYASICQANGLVPIVEPEVLADGAHSIDECAEKSSRVYAAVIKALHDYGVLLEGSLLKPNMITSGTSAPQKAGSGDVAWKTVQTLLRTVPAAIPGIMFLSGGQSEEEASVELNAFNALPGVKRPWTLSFSFGRALQDSCLKAWRGKPENVQAAQQALLKRAEANSKASLGVYEGGVGGDEAKESLFVSNYTY